MHALNVLKLDHVASSEPLGRASGACSGLQDSSSALLLYSTFCPGPGIYRDTMNSDLEEFSVGVHGLLSRQLSHASGSRSEEAIDALERDIGESMANVFRSFRRAKNDEVPINILPPELLALVLKHVDASALDAVLLTHVCQHWRTIALSQPQLWTHIYLHGRHCIPDTLSTFLQRTGALPVHIELGVDSGSALHNDAAALGRVVSDHLPRLESLSITGDSTWIGLMQSALVLPAPVLRTLELCDIDANTVGILQADVFSRKTPMLEKLVLENVVPVAWTNFLFTHLRELTLAGNCLSPSTFDIATCLRSTPELRHLELSCRIRPFPPHSGHELPWAAHNLRTLELSAQEDDSVITTVLEHLPISTLGRVEVTPVPLPAMVELLKSMPVPVTAFSLTAPAALSALTVRAAADGRTTSGVVPSTDGVPCALLFRHLGAPLTETLQRLALSYELWPHALALPPLPSLQTLVLRYGAVPPPAYQLSLFLNPRADVLRVPALETLALITTQQQRAPIKLATLVYLLNRALKFDADALQELVLVNIYAEEEPGNGDGLLTLCTRARKLVFLPKLPARLEI